MKNSSNDISRFQAVIVYDANTGGMSIFDFGIEGCELRHDGQVCKNLYGNLDAVDYYFLPSSDRKKY